MNKKNPTQFQYEQLYLLAFSDNIQSNHIHIFDIPISGVTTVKALLETMQYVWVCDQRRKEWLLLLDSLDVIVLHFWRLFIRIPSSF